MNPHEDPAKDDSDRASKAPDKIEEEKRMLISKHSEDNVSGRDKEIPIPSNRSDSSVEKLKYNGPTNNTPPENDDIKLCFSCSERIKYAIKSSMLCKCSNFKKSFIQTFTKTPFSLSEEIKDRMLEVKIHSTGPLMPNNSLIHPFIKIHFVNTLTSQYVQKTQPNLNILPFNENVSIITKQNNSVQIKEIETSFILPLSTRPFDLRISGETKAEYEEAFIIKELVGDIIKESTVMLFEILDYNHKLILEDKSQLNRDNLLPIAWGYLRVLGESNIHLRKKKIQLYYHKYKFNPVMNKKGIDLRTPEVFYDFNWPFHVFIIY